MYTHKMHVERRLILTALVPALLIILTGCGHRNEEIHGANIIGIRATITKILISPLAFDGAIVAVEGLARDVKKESSKEQKPVTIFKLSNLQGDFINVSTPGTLEISENDYLVVGGIYRRENNEIEAQEIQKIQLEQKKEHK